MLRLTYFRSISPVEQ